MAPMDADNDSGQQQQQPGPLFRPFRALGYITDDVPFAVQRRGKEAYVTVSVGRTWQVREMGGHRAIVAGWARGVAVAWHSQLGGGPLAPQRARVQRVPAMP